jgi:hypothetical protein
MNEQRPPSDLEIHVQRAQLALDAGTDPRAPGGEVTRALCGHWEHEPPCRWPHNNDVAAAIEGSVGLARFRTVFVAPAAEVEEVRSRIEAALRSDPRWRTIEVTRGDLDPAERTLGARLRQAGRRPS